MNNRTNDKQFGPLRGSVSLLCLILAGSVSAQDSIQLDETCRITIGNQTAFVQPDGSFLVRNISIFQSPLTGIFPQLFRVRATCLRDGQSITGQSGFFPLTPTQTTFVADVFPTDIDPIPVFINVSAPTTLLPLGVSHQLTVTATLPNRTTEDVTLRSEGTTYISTNPRLLTVSEDGLVTGQSPYSFPFRGTVVVLNEGNTSTFTFITVGPSDDFDNDGILNDYEELYGLDPFLNDANGDLDGDGLTNLEEFELGTAANNSDTDADGIPDLIDANPLHPEESPPDVIITTPLPGSTVIEGSGISFAADVSDDGLLTSVALSTSGGFFKEFTSPPFFATVPVPKGVTEMTLTVTASDSVPNVTEVSLVVQVVPDPRTTVQGTVTFQQLPVEGADVTVFDLATLSDEAGDFMLPGAFTIRGPIIARANIAPPSTDPMITREGPSPSLTNGTFIGASDPTVPLVGGVTDVGAIRLTKVKFDTFPGFQVVIGDDGIRRIPFQQGFIFPFAGQMWDEIYINGNGNLTFGGGDRTFDPAIPEGVVSGRPRISGLFTDLVPQFVFARSLASRFVVTFVRVPQFGEGGQNSFQIKLFTDGTIQIGYGGITADGFGDGHASDTLDVTVGISPGGTPDVVLADFSAGTPASIGFGEALIENFNTEGSFDLSGSILLFRPTGTGGFVSLMVPLLQRFSSSVSAGGPVVDGFGNPLPGALVVAQVRGAKGRVMQTTTDQQGQFFLEDLPRGEVLDVEAFFEGRFVGKGAVRLLGPIRRKDRGYTLTVRPRPMIGK